MKILRLIKMILVIAIVVLTISSCTPNKSHNFQVANVEVQKVSIDGMDSDSVNLYLMTIEMADCNRYYSLLKDFTYSYDRGILFPVQRIEGRNEKSQAVTSFMHGLSSYLNQSYSTLELEDEFNRAFFCPYSNDIASFIDELNSMGINLRVENYDKQKKCHFVRRLFCLPKDKGQLKQLLLYLENKMIVCKVAEESFRLKVKEHF